MWFPLPATTLVVVQLNWSTIQHCDCAQVAAGAGITPSWKDAGWQVGAADLDFFKFFSRTRNKLSTHLIPSRNAILQVDLKSWNDTSYSSSGGGFASHAMCTF